MLHKQIDVLLCEVFMSLAQHTVDKLHHVKLKLYICLRILQDL